MFLTKEKSMVGKLYYFTSYVESRDRTNPTYNSTNFKYNNALHFSGSENNGKLLLLINIITYYKQLVKSQLKHCS